jgi:hypothetical protein
MTREHCPRAWEVEAERDGRVSGPSRVALELHTQHCQVCSRERRYVDSLARALREDELPGEELAARRLRAVVLEQARRRPTTRVRWRLQVGLVAGLAAAALSLGLWWQQGAERRALGSAAWVGGETWHPEAAPTESGATHADVLPVECVAAPPQEEPIVTATRAPHEPSRGPAHARGGVAFGALGRAAQASPAALPPAVVDDGAAEDVAYLRVLALWRENRTEEVRSAARQYLMNFPNGFRRIEVEGLVGPRVAAPTVRPGRDRPEPAVD